MQARLKIPLTRRGELLIRLRYLAFSVALFAATGTFAANPNPDGLREPAFKNEVSITVENGVRIIRSNGIPDHLVGQFPGKGNPNTIAPQRYEFRVPAEPKAAEKTTPLRMQPFGVAVNGVVFDPGAAEWFNRDPRSGWQYEPMSLEGRLGCDKNNAHVQPGGAYHYHAIPTGLVEKLTKGQDQIALVGWAADGFPIYNQFGHSDPKDGNSPLKKLKSSYRLKKGVRPDGPKGEYDGLFVADYEYVPGSGDLDECNGRVAVTPEYPSGIYQYVLTEEFPFIPRQYRGTPDPSFATHGPRAGGAGAPGAAGTPGGQPGAGGRPGAPGGAAGPGAGGRPQPGRILPDRLQERLNLTAEQKAKVADLQKDIDAKLEQILNDEQKKQLKELRDAGPPGPPPAPPGGPQ